MVRGDVDRRDRVLELPRGLDDKLVVRQCGYLNAGLMGASAFPEDYEDASYGRSYAVTDDLSIADAGEKRVYCIQTQYTDAAGTDDVDREDGRQGQE